MKQQPLKVIVCGFERGGTTLLSEILRQHPNLEGGFEGGFLLADNPSGFISYKPEPYALNFKRGWKVSDEQLEYICKAQNWEEMYRRVVECSDVINNKDNWIFDKTPKYMRFLSEVLQKADKIPAIVLIRDPRAVLYSWAKREPMSIEEWQEIDLEKACNRYMLYAQGWYKSVQEGYNDRILLVRYEDLCINQETECRKIFEFINLNFSPVYLEFGKPQFPNVYHQSIGEKYLQEYKEGFSEKTCFKILELTSEIDQWDWGYT